MNKRFILVTVLAYYSLTIFSSEFYQIDATSKWIQEEIYIDVGLSYQKYNFSLAINGDTIINDKVYFKLVKNGQEYYEYHGYGPNTRLITNEYFGAILSDSNKVFIVYPDSVNETLLYDFNLSIGDTIKSFIGNGLIIQDFETLSNGRKKFLTSNNKFFIIEGIGSNLGLTRDTTMVNDWTEATLGCYYQSGNLEFVYNQVVCDYYSTDISKNQIIYNVMIYPNPSFGKLYFDLSGLKIESILILNYQGQILNIDESGNKNIDISNLNSGLYFIKINNKYTFKVLKI